MSRPTCSCAWLVLVVACSGEPATPEDTLTDTEVEVVGEVCTPRAVTCTRGVLATCHDDGSAWAYAACPAGQVCEVDGCVDNVPTVVLVAVPPFGDDHVQHFDTLPTELTAAIESALCDETPGCCDRVRSALAVPGHRVVQASTKYWVRRLLRDLEVRGTFSVSLLGGPSRLNPVDPTCQPPTSVEACLEGAPDLMRFSDWEVVAPEGNTGLPFASREQARALLDASVRVIDGDPETLLSWVDGVFAQDESGQVTNPELNTRQAGPYDLGLITWLYLTQEHRPEGRACAADTDCGHRHYRCVERRCTDPAAACRTQDVVVLGSFFDELPTGPNQNACYTGGMGGVDWDLWTRWFRWGVTCKTQRDCRAGSSCVNPCDFSDYPACAEPRMCLPDALAAHVGTDVLLVGALSDFTYWAPTSFVLDSAGRALGATFHTIFTGVAADSVATVGGPLYATSAALLGGGVAVTPVAPEVRSFFHDSFLLSFDYEARYDELLEALATHRSTTICTPELVGLGD